MALIKLFVLKHLINYIEELRSTPYLTPQLT
jgi:hypothetical protein